MSKLSNYSGAGQEQISDVKTFYLKLAQDITDETKKQKASYIPGLEAGMFFCPVTKRIYGPTVDVIVLATRKAYFLIDDDGDFKGAEEKILPTWHRDVSGALRTEEGYKAIVTYSYLVVTPDDLEHKMVLTLKNTDVPAAKDWNTMLKELKLDDGNPCPIFGGVWTLSAIFREGKKGSWYAISDGKSSNIKFKEFIADEIVDTIADTSKQLISSIASTNLIEDNSDSSGEKDM
jgi:hypothetical protein